MFVQNHLSFFVNHFEYVKFVFFVPKNYISFYTLPIPQLLCHPLLTCLFLLCYTDYHEKRRQSEHMDVELLMKNPLFSFVKSEIVLLLSLLLAVVSAFFVTPNMGYLDYIDFNTLALLFCLMAVTAGAARLGVFSLLAEQLLSRVRTMRGLSLALCFLCFFSSMLITNDVALITFIPFTIVVLNLSGQTRRLVPLAALETVAANLGSMLTPIGNPQNLYLFTFYKMEAIDFFSALLPYGLLSLALLIGSVVFIGKDSIGVRINRENVPTPARWKYGLYALLFLLSLLTVFRVIPWPITLGITFLSLLLLDRFTLKQVDYSLLLTFLFLFIFIGNLGRIPAIHNALQGIVLGYETLVGVLASQIFSNVPAAVLLSNFTQNASALLVGVNLGGLGTLIASMASLISFKFVIKEGIKVRKYLYAFTWINVLFLAANLLLWSIL